MNMIISAGLYLLTGIISYISHRKAVKANDRVIESLNEAIESLKESLRSVEANNKTLFIEDKVKEVIENYYDNRTPRNFEPYIDTLECGDDEKAKILELAMMRVKGRKPKKNPYGKFE